MARTSCGVTDHSNESVLVYLKWKNRMKTHLITTTTSRFTIIPCNSLRASLSPLVRSYTRSILVIHKCNCRRMDENCKDNNFTETMRTLRPGDFIRKLRESIVGRIKALKFAFNPLSTKVLKRQK